jgi:hypothetical protein
MPNAYLDVPEGIEIEEKKELVKGQQDRVALNGNLNADSQEYLEDLRRSIAA